MAQLPLKRYSSLDFWRGVVCLKVVLFHASFYALAKRGDFHGAYWFIFGIIEYLGYGVAAFFVISGYCISATCDSMLRKPQSVKDYFWRRYHRIFPPFWICFSIALAVVLLARSLGPVELLEDKIHPIANPGTLSLGEWIGNLTLIESWRGIVFGGSAHYFLGNVWSLCYQEQFYVVCGLLLFIGPRFFFRNSLWLSLGILVVTITTLIFQIRVAGSFFDGRWFQFALGILVYWLLNHSHEKVERPIRWILIFASACTTGIFVFAWFRNFAAIAYNDRFVGLVIALVFSVILIYLRPYDDLIMGSRILAPVTWCGTMCYSLYLVHWPVVKAVSHGFEMYGISSPLATLLLVIPVCIILSVAAARMFYLGVERHFLNSRPPDPQKNTRQLAETHEVVHAS